jgi:DNA-binding FadR family transcriptional regulator
MSEEAAMSADLSAAERAYDRLKQDILTGVLPIGAIDLRRVADSLRMSVTPVREALARLGAERFVKRDLHGYSLVLLSPQRLEQLYQISAGLIDLSVAQALRTRWMLSPPSTGSASAPPYAEGMTALLKAIAAGPGNAELTTYLSDINDRLLPARRREPDIFPDARQDLRSLKELWERCDHAALRVFLRSYHETRIARVDAIARRLAAEAGDP